MTAPQAVAVSHWTRRTITPPTPYHTHQDTYHPLTAQEGTNPMTEHRPTPIHSPSIMSFLIASRNLTAAPLLPSLASVSVRLREGMFRQSIWNPHIRRTNVYPLQYAAIFQTFVIDDDIGKQELLPATEHYTLAHHAGTLCPSFFSENHSLCNSDSPPPFSCPRFRNPEPGRLKEKFPQPRSIWSSKFFILKLTPPIRCVNWNPNMEKDHGAIQRCLLEVGPRVDGATPRSASPTICPSIGLSLPRDRIYGARP